MNDNNPNNKSVAEIISDIKDYANLADAAYAYYEFIDENEEWNYAEEFYNYKILNTPNPKLIYADGVKQGDKIEFLTELCKTNKINFDEPTAYALAIEASFMKNKENLNLKNYNVNN